MLFVLGGNGTHAGANAIHEEVYKTLLIQFNFALSYLYINDSNFNLACVHWTLKVEAKTGQCCDLFTAG